MLTISVHCDPLTESNGYLLQCRDEALIIDPNDAVGLGGMLGSTALTTIILTHEHCDHIAGLSELRSRWPQASVIASQACSQALGNAGLNMSRMMSVYLAFQGKGDIDYPGFVCEGASRTFEERLRLEWQGHLLECVGLPGHTGGSTAILLDGERLFSGDYLIPGGETITRLPGGSPERYTEKTLPWLKGLNPGLHVFPGHGEPYVLRKEVLDAL
ncbi:Glyoxylase, beta-lactamase superfamily II [Eubacterium aggregans]|uniref:Glyoxylase, beta-lactamase superfamily II n=1 Tax=Eubacterium aggregans TaxID=81409 RepID=A0A1H3WVP5_9FIRM|nr:MBL fold metallo-hydrolase [Eubacterium aggregans]SDZ90412.1 Glyoxylase, beta-lactamase superfamily II [Eubacterium aggregans]